MCPDFVIELRSKRDRLNTLQEKMREYLANGARLGWLINSQNQQVEIYRRGGEVEVLARPKQLSGEKVIANFTLDLQRFW